MLSTKRDERAVRRLPWARNSRSNRGRKAGQIAPQPAWVTGPRQGVPWATMTQTLPRLLALDADAVGLMFGLRPCREGDEHLEQLHLVDRAAAQFEIDVDVVRDRRRCFEGLDVVRRGIDDVEHLRHVLEVAQGLNAAGGGAGADGDQQVRTVGGPPGSAPRRAAW